MLEILIFPLKHLIVNYQVKVRNPLVNPNENERETRKTVSVSGAVVKRSKGKTW
jgi:hypothetical protein